MKSQNKPNMFYKIVKIIKNFFNTLFSFLFGIFKSNNKVLNEKVIISNKTKKEEIKRKNIESFPTGSPNEPDSRIIDNENIILNINNEEIKKELAKIYCKELKIKFENLNKEQYDFLQLLENKIILPVRENINNKNILSKEELHISLENKVKEELKVQLILSNSKNENKKTYYNNNNYQESSKNGSQIIDSEQNHEETLKDIFSSNTDPVNNNVYNNPPTHNNEFKILRKLKDYNVALTSNNTYVLTNLQGQIITREFKSEIVDCQDNYLTIFKNNRYYVYNFYGDILDDTGYLRVDLNDGYYVVITDEDKELTLSLDIHKYNDKDFRLIPRIPVNINSFDNDYEVKSYETEFEIKIKSSRKTYYADRRTGKLKSEDISENFEKSEITENTDNNAFLNESNNKESRNILETLEQNNNYNIPPQLEDSKEIELGDNTQLETILEANDSLIETRLDNLENTNSDNQDIPIFDNEAPEKTLKKDIPQENEKKKNEQKDESKPKKDDDISEKINFAEINNNLNNILYKSKIEVAKEELEDKDYEALENEINSLLNKIASEKRKAKNNDNLNKLNRLELEVNDFKNRLEIQKNIDIKKEKDNLECGLHISEIYGLQTELKNIYLDNKNDLKEYSLENVEDLNLLDPNKANDIQKALLIKELKKAKNKAKISNIVTLPFIRNRYFRLFVSGMLVKNHLKMYENILKKQNIEFRESNFNNMLYGHTALNGALSLTVRNLNRLKFLEEMTKSKFPDMAYNVEYKTCVNDLKNTLLSEEEKMLRKKKMIAKYKIESKTLIRERKKDNKAA